MMIDVLRKKYKASMSVVVYQRNRSNRNNTLIGYTYTHICEVLYISYVKVQTTKMTQGDPNDMEVCSLLTVP